jgi:hypothetical protein
MRLILTAAALMLSINVSGAESVYTSPNLDTDCAVVETNEVGGTWKCKGFKDYPVWFSEGDARQSVFIGHVGDWYQKGAWESFGQFNHYGGTVEWVLENGAPFAAVTRFFVQNSEDTPSKNEGQVLVISKVGQPGAGEACVIGYVCRRDEPVYHGIKGPTAGEPYRDFAQ